VRYSGGIMSPPVRARGLKPRGLVWPFQRCGQRLEALVARAFEPYVGIDYSGAQKPTASLKGLRVYLTEADKTPAGVLPPPSPKKYWTRKRAAEWLVERLSGD
jgi:hypothetical protein